MCSYLLPFPSMRLEVRFYVLTPLIVPLDILIRRLNYSNINQYLYLPFLKFKSFRML